MRLATLRPLPLLVLVLGCLLPIGCGSASAAKGFRCSSDVDLGPVVAAPKKGLALDDTTFWNCSSQIPVVWPNTEERVRTLRLFKAWDFAWPEEARESVWGNFVGFVKANRAKVLVGAQITCSEKDDDAAWNWTKQLLKLLGPKHVMGLAVGNEMELLFTKAAVDPTVTPECITRMWGGGDFWRQFVRRVEEFDEMGFERASVTNVFGGLVLAGVGAFPFFEDPKAMCNSFFMNATHKYRSRYVFTFNLYPYFDPSNEPDPGTTDSCSLALAKSTCISSARCSLVASTSLAREKMMLLAGADHDLWLGETGWSSSWSASLATRMAGCQEWSSQEAFRNFYHEFLRWDLGGRTPAEHGIRPPDHVFYFTARDSVNFGVAEHFGLVDRCHDQRCKIRSAEYTAPPGSSTTTTTTSRRTSATSKAEATSTTQPSTSPDTNATMTTTTTSDDDDGGDRAWPSPPHSRTMRPPPFDCEADIRAWATGWSEGKKAWCCLHAGLDCPRTTTTAVTTSTSTTSTTATSTTTSSSTSSTTGLTTRYVEEAVGDASPSIDLERYECRDVLNMAQWTSLHRSWCCVTKDVGCPVTTTAPFDCQAALDGWAESWSEAKKSWCCNHSAIGIGCSSFPDYPQLEDLELGASTLTPYDCEEGVVSDSDSGWSPGKRAWCCLHHGLRCPRLDQLLASAAYVSSPTAPLAPITGGYDCTADTEDWQAVWSLGKQRWCCQRVGLGCKAEEQAPYDCGAGPTGWLTAWSTEKQTWCCRQQQVGCEHDQVVLSKKFDAAALGRAVASQASGFAAFAALAASAAALWGVRSWSRASAPFRRSLAEARGYSRVSFLEPGELEAAVSTEAAE